MNLNTVLFGACIGSAIMIAVQSNSDEMQDALSAFAQSELAGWMTDDVIVSAIKAQNAKHSGLSQADIDALDQQWRGEIGGTETPLINDVLGRAGSEFLRGKKDETAGVITEVFVMDNHGLNVIQSDLTSDYWQGDEDKFQATYGQGVGSIHVGDVELDESSGQYQSQVSMVVTDPASGEAIGAVTFGINVDLLQ